LYIWSSELGNGYGRASEIAISLAPETGGACHDHSSYVLGADDQVTILVPELEEINGKQFRIDRNGEVGLPLAGRLKAAGLTSEALGRAIETRLRRFVNNPEVIVSITEFRSQPISVLGLVGLPGVYQVQGCKTLFEILSLAGGLKPEAGDQIRITRDAHWGKIPLPQAKDDPSGRFSVASVNVKSILNASNPAENIAVEPNDVISVPKAELVYVVGAVHKPGGFVLGQETTISVLQVLSLAEGPVQTAATKNAKIIRSIPGTTNRAEIPIDVARLLSGKTVNDPRLQADDILFVPESAAKNFRAKTFDAAITAIAGAAIYRPF